MCSFQIAEKVAQVKEVQERLGKVWQERKEYNDQLYDFHIFLRDTNQLNNTSSSQEVRKLFSCTPDREILLGNYCEEDFSFICHMQQFESRHEETGFLPM